MIIKLSENNIHLFTTIYGYGWGAMVVVAPDMQTAIRKFLVRMKKEMYREDDYGYCYVGTLDMFGDSWYFYESE